MREILFRAKRIDNGEWVEGYPVKYPSGEAEIFKECGEPPDILLRCEIHPETLCQYTGLHDKNGKKIWENDIIRVENSADEGTGQVEFYGGMWYVDKGVNNSLYDIMMYDDEAEVYTVGNIFDNPELLK
ncbi:YopX protein [Blautia hydrogenotrophica]|uniref:YopX family protein n=1 Tax=Blautia hydrogenotrophica TaxID=53443 RepID=UPI0006C71A5B|nr:YopX family protein [Blautia hydrogenotrophica]CUM74479.1 YopX protein [Blautia hydrogenotrophica]SCH64425.1 YopX protein [uncultured Blautia sp.]